MYEQHMILKLRKPILKYTLNKYHVHWLSFLNILNCQSVLKYMSLYGNLFILYITAISPNTTPLLFLKLVLAGLYFFL